MQDEANGTSEKYLIYQLGEESFATPLIEIREVIEYRPAKSIPHTSPFFKGVINIRGEIVGVLDLRERLNLKGSPEPMTQLVFETESGSLAAIVDRVHSVTVIDDNQIERRNAVHGGGNATERGYFLGVAKVEERLVTVVSLRKILTAEQLVDLPSQSS